MPKGGDRIEMVTQRRLLSWIAAPLAATVVGTTSTMGQMIETHGGRLGGIVARHCVLPNITFCRGCSIDMSIAMKAGATCAMYYRPNGAIHGQQVIARPKYGKYGTANPSTGAYRPSSGYHGKDHFRVRIYFQLPNGQPTYSELRADVTVTP
jgi:hypothetical protein